MSKKYSIGLIILFFVIFYPVAIFMVVWNAAHSEEKTRHNSTAARYTNPFPPTAPVTRRPAPPPVVSPFQTAVPVKEPPKKNPGRSAVIAGAILAGIGGALLTAALLNFFDGGAFSIAVIVLSLALFILGGAMLIVIGVLTAKKEERRRAYVTIVNRSVDLSIRGIAKKMNRSESQAVRDLESMLKDGYFPHCRIDAARTEFCLPGTADAKKYDYRTVPVSCRSCGAKTVVLAGTVKRCEYCGSPLAGDIPAKGFKPSGTAAAYKQPYTSATYRPTRRGY